MGLFGTQQLHCHTGEVRPGEASVVSSNQIKHLALSLTQHVHNWANMLLRNLYDSLFIWLALVPIDLLCDNLRSGAGCTIRLKPWWSQVTAVSICSLLHNLNMTTALRQQHNISMYILSS